MGLTGKLNLRRKRSSNRGGLSFVAFAGILPFPVKQNCMKLIGPDPRARPFAQAFFSINTFGTSKMAQGASRTMSRDGAPENSAFQAPF